MSSLSIKRIVAFAVSMALGFGLAALFVTTILPWMGPNNGMAISVAKYGTQYFFWTAFPLGLFFLVWFDHFMDTRIFPD